MRNIIGNLFSTQAQAVCITTNGFTKSNGECVMGRGCALELVKRMPEIPRLLGSLIKSKGNSVHIVSASPAGKVILSFPVKPVVGYRDGNNVVSHATKKFSEGERVPGFLMKADPTIIRESARQLRTLADANGWTSVLLPRPGCGAGELSWSVIEPLLQEELDDRFSCITFK